ncbi:uncharacterized protein FIESC28_05881 [Fusarium coffeatum]|uniref:Metallo-beta-lactamase domain-containing protein n=1 Tax=Fusarium coffeatum TaxID=231269 RepID=A0A366RQS5_9HYPO|nr:uncharacterized protein FIESC28_05881 [Fusarium coffeatum]RBR18740.1 hypothetical protein FIESC28_05881 [Fusarium coffeatum]
MGTGGYKQINKALNVSVFEDYLQSQQARLPRLPDVQQLSPRVIRILGQNTGKFTLQGTNTYIIGTGKQRLIIDTGQGIPKWADLVESTLDKGSFSLSMVMLTHWHGDHTGGVPDLIRMYPTLAGHIYKHSPAKDQRSITDEQIFSVEGATVRAVHGPGHSHDHVCFVLEEENAMFTGDNILGHGTSAVEDLATYMRTLNTMKSQHCRIGYPAHGEVIPDLPAPDPNPLCPSGTQNQLLCLTILGYRRSDLSEEQYRDHMINISAPMTKDLMAKYGIRRWTMIHNNSETRELMYQLMDPQMANIADYDCFSQVVFKSIDDYKKIKEDPWYKEHLVGDHENFADTKRSKMTIGWITEFVRDGKVADRPIS